MNISVASTLCLLNKNLKLLCALCYHVTLNIESFYIKLEIDFLQAVLKSRNQPPFSFYGHVCVVLSDKQC